jgi:hypothetical protein
MDGTADRIAERVGPIVVKEVRQGLRARLFTVFFTVLLVGCACLAIVFFARATSEGRTEQGIEAFGLYLSALGAICFFVIPFVAFRSMLREVEDETWVLLTLTGLGAQRIVRGKWVSAMSQALLFGSACAPFVVFSYFLNGIDLVRVVAGLTLTAGWTGTLSALGLAVAAQAHSRLGRTVAHFVVLASLALLALGGVAFAWAIADSGARLVTSSAFRNVACGVGLFSWVLTWLLLEGAAAGLALPSEAASRGPRRALVATVGTALAFGATLFMVQSGRSNDAVAGNVLVCAFLGLAGPFCVSERDGWPAPASGGGWLKPGAVRSYGVFLGLVLLSLATWSFMASVGTGNDFGLEDRRARGLLAAAAYPVLYASVAVVLGRVTPLAHLGEPVATRLGFVIALAFGIFGSLGAGLAIEGRASAYAPNTFNPTVGLINLLDRSGSELSGAMRLLTFTTVASVFAAAAVLHGRDEVRAS